MIEPFLLSPLTDFAQMILQYFIDIWDFLLFMGGSASVIVVLIGAILKFVQVKVGKLTGTTHNGWNNSSNHCCVFDTVSTRLHFGSITFIEK